MQLFNIEDSSTGRQANNVLRASIREAVRPWFSEVSDSDRVIAALNQLGSPRAHERAAASSYLGVRLTRVA